VTGHHTAELEVVGNQRWPCLLKKKLLTWDTLSWWLFGHVHTIVYLCYGALVFGALENVRQVGVYSVPPVAECYSTKVRLYSDMAMGIVHKKRSNEI